MDSRDFEILVDNIDQRRLALLNGTKKEIYEGEFDRLRNFKDIARIYDIMLGYREEGRPHFVYDHALVLMLKHFVRLLKILGKGEKMTMEDILETIGDLHNYLDLIVALMVEGGFTSINTEE